MACMNFGRSCFYSCPNLVKSTAVTLVDSQLVISIPSGVYPNDKQICLAICQALPALTAVYPVVIQIGSSTPYYPLRCRKGHNVYSDQISCRKVYCLNVATDTQSFVYVGTMCLPKTSFTIPGSLPVPVAATASTVATPTAAGFSVSPDETEAVQSGAKNYTKTTTTKVVLKAE